MNAHTWLVRKDALVSPDVALPDGEVVVLLSDYVTDEREWRAGVITQRAQAREWALLDAIAAMEAPSICECEESPTCSAARATKAKAIGALTALKNSQSEENVMSIPRWEVDGSLEPSRGFGTEVVLLTDHVSAVEAARAEERDGLMDEMLRRFTGNREQTIDDCIAVVPEEICTCATWKPYHFEWCSITRVNAALRTLKEQP